MIFGEAVQTAIDKYLAIGSLAGAVLGYYIGLKGGRPLLNRMFDENKVRFVERHPRGRAIRQQRDVWAVAIAGFTPIPYKVFAIGAGVFRLDMRRFLLASAVGPTFHLCHRRAFRGRFFLVAGIVMIFGEAVQTAIDKYLDILTIAFIA